MQLSVIIVSYNVKYFLEQCLYAVEAACEGSETEIIVVDNASDDNSIAYLRSKFEYVKFIRNETNLGFAKANNTGLSIASGDFILFLNPDTIVAENTINDCLRFLSEHPDVGAVGLKMIDGSGNFLPESKRAFPSAIASFFKLSGIAQVFPRSPVFNRYALANISEDAIAEVDVLAGAFLMARTEILLEMKGFDEDFFMYGEDIDLSYRIQRSGWKNFYLGNISIIHFKGESTQKQNSGYRKNFYHAMKVFVNKHYSKTYSVFLKPFISLGGFAASFKNKGSGKQKNDNTNFILVGDDQDLQSAKNILSNLKLSVQRINSLSELNQSITNQPSNVSQSAVDKRETSNVRRQTSNIVFCTGKLSYADTIHFIQRNKNRFPYYWHKGDSGSIAGGSDSNTTGKIYNM